MKFDVSGLLVKSKEHDSKINNDGNNVNSNFSLIKDNKSNISENLKSINSKSDIIEDNKRKISENLKLINTKSDIIEDNKNNITNNYNISQINKKKSEFNTKSIDNNINSINSIKNDIENYYKLKDIIIIDIEKTNITETIDINNHEFIIVQSSLNNIFIKDSYIQFDSSILIFFNKHYINIGFFHILLEYFDDKNVLIESIKMPIIGMISRHCNITNSFIIKLPDNFNEMYFKLSIKLNDNQNRTDSISILDFDNKIYFKCFEK